MNTSHKLTSVLMALVALVVLTTAALAQAVGPGFDVPVGVVNDQKAGSVLIYNYYTSSPTSPAAQNTRINITNTDPKNSAFVHLFFVDGGTCAPADAYICLTPNQTASFLASDVDPGTTGYIVAVASCGDPQRGDLGCPIRQNTLIGDEYVKQATGHTANLGAEALAAIDLSGIACTDTATLNFNGTQYDRVGGTLAVDNIPSPADGNSTLVVINAIRGSLLTGAGSVSSIFGILFDDAETPFSFTVASGRCQLVQPVVGLRILGGGVSGAIPAGRSGWMKFWSTSNFGLLGAALNFNPSTATSPSAFTGGHNLHKLTLQTGSFTIPVFPPAC
jgi:hypothetical protein